MKKSDFLFVILTYVGCFGCSDQRFFLDAEVRVQDDLAAISESEGPLAISAGFGEEVFIRALLCFENGHPDRGDGLYVRQAGSGQATISELDDGRAISRVEGSVVIPLTYEARSCGADVPEVIGQVWTVSAVTSCEDVLEIEDLEVVEVDTLIATKSTAPEREDGACWRRSFQQPIDGSGTYESVSETLVPVVLELSSEDLEN